MFFFKEYNNYIVNVHIHEKIKFYRYKYFLCLKPILLLLKYIRIKYKISNNIYSQNLFIGTKLFFFYYFNIPVKYLNYSASNNSCYSLVILNNLVYKYNVFYYFFISYNYSFFKTSCFLELYKNKKKNSKIYKNIRLHFETLSDFPYSRIFKAFVTINSNIIFSFKSNSNNIYFNKLLYSHTFFNVI